MKHIASTLVPGLIGQCYVRFEVFRAVNMKGIIIWDVSPCDSCESTHSEECVTSIVRVKN
jgi:hypothetical protein